MRGKNVVINVRLWKGMLNVSNFFVLNASIKHTGMNSCNFDEATAVFKSSLVQAHIIAKGNLL